MTWLLLRDRRAATVIGLVVFSHWLLDWTVHLPDLPLFIDGSPILDLGLWGNGPGLIARGILEFVMLGIGITIYTRYKRKESK